ncbi:hypothetical protein [Rhizobium hidalgonense]|uniref:hypothetical protein n=1 Tax=Rhizobium hidalgonense TaxID=1538159 RepID=UPI00110581FC|nr:hypothetical protein [Rhizobium hidalgonense]QKK28002.1 hypothetical protein FFM81_032440 [Rhizobium hidalgonense]
MSDHEYNPLVALYGVPRAVIHPRVSARNQQEAPQSEEDGSEKIGNCMFSLISLKDQSTTGR